MVKRFICTEKQYFWNIILHFMKKKINLLIGFSTLVLLILIAIQVYLVKTTYDYKVEQFHSEVKDKIGNITNNYTELDSSIFSKKDILYKGIMEKFINDKDYRNQIKEELLANKYRSALTHLLQQKLKQAFPKNEFNFSVITTKFIVYNSAKTDTLFAERPTIDNAIYGDLASLDNAFQIRNYVGTTSGFKNADYKLLTEDTLYVSVTDWEQ